MILLDIIKGIPASSPQASFGTTRALSLRGGSSGCFKTVFISPRTGNSVQPSACTAVWTDGVIGIPAF